MSASKHIVVMGSSNTDMIVRVPQIPAPGETLLGGRFLTAYGGKGANQAVGAARAGGRIKFVARIGADVFGERALAALRQDGIDTRNVTRDRRAPSGVALIFVADSGENSIAVAGGANGRLSNADVKRAAADISVAASLVMQLETPLASVHAAAKLAFKSGVPVLLNPAPAQPLPRSLLECVAILTPNETEAESLTGIKVRNVAAAAKACAVLRSRGVRTVIITMGAHGAFVSEAARSRLVRGFKVKAVDTTAAGDIFNGALSVALAESQILDDAVRFANAAAAISVTRVGAQPSAPSRAEIERFLRRNR